MAGIFGRILTGITLATFGCITLGSPLEGQPRGTRHPVDMPVSLKAGSMRTPEFITGKGPYEILVLVKKRLPGDAIDCMLGIRFSSDEPVCKNEPALQVNWRLWSEGQVVAQGSTNAWRNVGVWAKDVIGRSIGWFDGKKGRKYTLELNFTKDGSALDIAEPRLVVQLSDYN